MTPSEPYAADSEGVATPNIINEMTIKMIEIIGTTSVANVFSRKDQEIC